MNHRDECVPHAIPLSLQGFVEAIRQLDQSVVAGVPRLSYVRPPLLLLYLRRSCPPRMQTRGGLPCRRSLKLTLMLLETNW